MTARRYCLLLLLATSFGMIAVMAFNFYVDPYGIRDWEAPFRLSGFRQEPDKNERVFKLMSVARVRPEVLILGTSRAAHGIDPDHFLLKELAPSRFNAAFDGANIVEIESLVKYLAAIPSVPKLAILGLDFMAFADCASKTDNNRIAKMTDGLPAGELGPRIHLAKILSSLDTVRASIRTQQDGRSVAFHDKNGRRLDQVFEERIKERGGYDANFQKLEADFFRLYLIEQSKCFDLGDDENLAFKAFRDLLSTAYASEINLKMFVSPIHARQLEVIRLSGLWSQYEIWLGKMTAISENEARVHGKEPFSIFDFSSYEGLVAKAVSEGAVGSNAVSWYWESSHYKKALGDIVLGRILGGGLPDSKELYSTLLTTRSLDEHLSLLRDAELKYVKEQPEAFRQLMRIKCEVVKEVAPCI